MRAGEVAAVENYFWTKPTGPLSPDDPQFEHKLTVLRKQMAFYCLALLALGIWMFLDVSKLKGTLALVISVIPAAFAIGGRWLVLRNARRKKRSVS
jgi:hypothetical protein